VIEEDDLQAHWQRIWLRAPGIEDHETRVHWMQCGPLYADLRVPADRPDPGGAEALADLSPEALLCLMRAEGFAGAITVEDGVCTWAREINWHGTPDGIDAGLMSFDDMGDLIEDGVHAEYAELWRRAPDPAVKAIRIEGGAMQGVLILSEHRFLIGLGQPGAPSSAALIAALEAGYVPPGLPKHFASHYVMGVWDGAVGTAQLATNPFLEGQIVLTRAGAGFQFAGVGFDGRAQEIDLSV